MFGDTILSFIGPWLEGSANCGEKAGHSEVVNVHPGSAQGTSEAVAHRWFSLLPNDEAWRQCVRVGGGGSAVLLYLFCRFTDIKPKRKASALHMYITATGTAARCRMPPNESPDRRAREEEELEDLRAKSFEYDEEDSGGGLSALVDRQPPMPKWCAPRTRRVCRPAH